MTMPDVTSIRARSKANAHATLGLMDELVALRKKRRLSQDQVAERMGVTQPAVSQMERYDSNPTIRTIQKYANAVHGLLRLHVDDGESKPRTASPPAEHWLGIGKGSSQILVNAVAHFEYAHDTRGAYQPIEGGSKCLPTT